jgi:hypothetical protein
LSDLLQNKNVKFFLGRRETLTAEQLRNYSDRGFLLTSGLISKDVVERARSVLLDLTSNRDPGSYHEFVSHPAILACYTRQLCSAAKHLAGAFRRFAPPCQAYAITVLPNSRPWNWPAPHIDHAIKEDGYRTFPPPYRVGSLIYLNHVLPRSGATVVWPGSHHQLKAAAIGRKEYEYLWALNQDLPKLTFGKPLEITTQPGDVLFYHYLCAHSGSVNTGVEPRLALNHKW